VEIRTYVEIPICINNKPVVTHLLPKKSYPQLWMPLLRNDIAFEYKISIGMRSKNENEKMI
jgi:hypothetical protein